MQKLCMDEQRPRLYPDYHNNKETRKNKSTGQSIEYATYFVFASNLKEESNVESISIKIFRTDATRRLVQ